MTSSQKISTTNTKMTGVAAIDCPLVGGYLIEASAGTGKTWTLTGILLRLLIEKKLAPEKIVATTFTRAAASEMQERLYERLLDFEVCCQWLRHYLLQENLYHCDLIHQTAIIAQASNRTQALSDPINVHLLLYLLTQHPNELEMTLRRTAWLLASLNKLFIGTLDSLAQKWLNEFGTEIGIVKERTIQTDTSEQQQAIIHDYLRNLQTQYVQLCQNNPRLSLYLGDDILFDVASWQQKISHALHFFSAPIDVVAPIPTLKQDFYDKNHRPKNPMLIFSDELFCLLDEHRAALLLPDLWVDILPYGDKAYRQAQGMSASDVIAKNLGELTHILNALSEKNIEAFDGLSSQSINLLTKLSAYDDQSIKNAVKFNQGHEAHQARWQGLALGNLVRLAMLYRDYRAIKVQFDYALLAYLASVVRDELRQLLDKDDQTTFGLQMMDLTAALHGQKGKLLARYIRHLYPAILIDEAQDMSGEQAGLIEKLYLSVDAKKNLAPDGRGFVLLVGDPKQAIYRFRGGDVANYNFIKNLGLDTSFSLLVNRRSNEALVSVLNQWFLGQAYQNQAEHQNIDNNYANANLGEQIYYRAVAAVNTQKRLSWQQDDTVCPSFLTKKPLAFLHFDEQTDTDERMLGLAWHIDQVLQSGERILTDEGERVLVASDIAVLARGHEDLAQIRTALQHYHIPVSIGRMGSVFDTVACVDIYALLLALQNNREEALGAVLTGLCRLTLEQSGQILTDGKKRSQLLIYLKGVHWTWQNLGIVAALNRAFLTLPKALVVDGVVDVVADDKQAVNLWHYLACFEDGERYLTDVWQLFELLAQKSDYQPRQLMAYLVQQMTQKTADETHKRLPLAGSLGVQLMTIHAAKGLEFAVVYVMSLASQIKSETVSLYPYTKDNERRLSASPSSPTGKDDLKQHNQQENFDELKRLGYVALTRASEQLFILTYDKKRAENQTLLNAWGFYNQGKTVQIPTHLQNYIEKIDMNAQMAQVLCDEHHFYQSTNSLVVPIVFEDWAKIYKKMSFQATYRTSFTNLAWQFDWAGGLQLPTNHKQTQVLLSTSQPSITSTHTPKLWGADDFDEPLEEERLVAEVQDIRFGFVRGAYAGLFLHQVLEAMALVDGMEMVANYKAKLGQIVHNQAKKMASPLFLPFCDDEVVASNPKQQALVDWLYDIAHQPFLASGAVFARLPIADKKSELGFVLGTAGEVDIQSLEAVFLAHADRPLYHFDDNAVRYFSYLSGEMDLVYAYQGKYYVVDYKSNFLGDTLADYHQENMMAVMDKQGYWLQAAIYQLALHRLLKLRIADYQGNEDNYLGAVEYVFLRGIDPQAKGVGRLCWQVPLALILALDDLL